MTYRPNVGAALFGPDGRVLVARRAMGKPAAGAWQLPQGGIDPGETAEQAVLRELEEEIGTRKATILAAHPDWLTYDFPADAAKWGTHRGQTQRWFALRFDGSDHDIRLDAHLPAEFDAWKWAPLAEVPGLAPSFKREIYVVVASSFARFAGSS